MLENPSENAIVLYGQRRIGKTSVLQELLLRLPDIGPYRTVYFDLQDKASRPLPEVLHELASSIAERLGLEAPPKWPSDHADAFRSEFLPQVLAKLRTATGATAKSSLVVLFDEFDVLDEPAPLGEMGHGGSGDGPTRGHLMDGAGRHFFPYLRGLLSLDSGIQFVFVIGRRMADLTSGVLSLFKGVKARPVSLLSEAETGELVRLSEQNGSLAWDPAAIGAIWNVTGGHPFLTQQLCQEIWEAAHQDEPGDTPIVRAADVDAAIPVTLRSAANALEWLWDGLGPAQRVVASALAEAGARPITQAELETRLQDSGVRILVGELQDAPRMLREWDLLDERNGTFVFRVELLRRWIADRKPLARVQEEIDKIQPVADNLFQAASGFYRAGNFAESIALLKQAIGLNPNHLRANRLLAELWLAEGKAAEARELLESLYRYQPAAARPRLVQALLLEARTASLEHRAELIKRVLELDPHHPEARDQVFKYWKEQAEAAMARGDLDRAIAAYQNAGLTSEAADVEAKRASQRLAATLQQIRKLEREEKFADALRLANVLHRDFPAASELPNLERLERKTQLAGWYQRALRALSAGQAEAATTLLADVIALEPAFHEAPRYLYQAVTGIDPQALAADLDVFEKRVKDLSSRLEAAQDHERALEIELRKSREELVAATATKRGVRRGFGCGTALVVGAAFLLFAIIAIPQLLGAREKARNATCDNLYVALNGEAANELDSVLNGGSTRCNSTGTSAEVVKCLLSHHVDEDNPRNRNQKAYVAGPGAGDSCQVSVSSLGQRGVLFEQVSSQGRSARTFHVMLDE